MAYRLLYRLVLTRIDAEAIHHATIRLLALLSRMPPVLALLRLLLGRPSPALRVRAFGVEFPAPLGMAAGFDKDAVAYRALAAFGFGFVEVGTVTGLPQPGNDQPRLFRLPADQALVNRMGFNNRGSEDAARRLARRSPGTLPVLGVNIGKSKVVPAEEAAADYVASTRRLAPHADYLVVNVSSPNTPGLRDLQATEALRPLLEAVKAEAGATPVLVKIAPDLADEDVDAVADLAVELGLEGIVATNTTIGREGLLTPARDVEAIGAGGLSGAPLKARAEALLRRLHARVGDRLVIVSVGGIETAEDAWRRLTAGATLVQGYTGMVYGGPLWAHRINRGIAKRLAQAGFANLEQAIGTDTGHARAA